MAKKDFICAQVAHARWRDTLLQLKHTNANPGKPLEEQKDDIAENKSLSAETLFSIFDLS